MKTKNRGIALAWLVSTLLLTACGGGGGSSSVAGGATYTLSGQVQKGPFGIGSQVSVNELDDSLNPTGKVYNVQTTDDLGNFAVASIIGSHLVEMVADGFYMDELTGQLAASRIQLRAVADLSVDSTPTINILTSLQAQRLKQLISQGTTYAAANTQSQNEVLTAFGIDPTKINSLSTLYSMQINGNTDADSVLLAVSTILSKMATNSAVANSTTQPAELSNYISTIAAQITNTGTITSTATITARNLAATQIDLVAVRTNVETYYVNRGVTIVAPKFEEWVDKDASGILPRRLVPVAGLTFTDVPAADPEQLITSNAITVAGVGAGIVATVTANAGTTIIKNSVAVSGTNSTAQDGDAISMRITSLGYGLTNSATISVGSSYAVWQVTTKPLSGTISGLTGTGLVLQNNAGDNITIPPNSTSFSFSASVANGATYNVTVLTQPATPLQVCTVTNGTGTVGAALSNISVGCVTQAGVAYVTNAQSNNISAYGIDPTTGALSSIGTFTTGNYPYSIAIDPNGKFAYVVNNGATNTAGPSSIQTYSINAGSGALVSIGTVPTGTVSASRISVDPTGKFAYVADNNDLLAYSINTTTGALTSIGTYGSNATGSNPAFVSVDPTGKFAYVANFNFNNVLAYSINTTTGALTSIGTFAAGTLPLSISIDPTGKFAYTTNQGSNDISAYSINVTTGALTNIGTYGPTAVVNNDTYGAIDPTGKFVYVTSRNASNVLGDVSAYTINTTTGALTSIGTFAAGFGPQYITVDPTGKFAYVANGGNGSSMSNNVSAYTINSVTGALTSSGTFAAGTWPTSIAIKSLP